MLGIGKRKGTHAMATLFGYIARETEKAIAFVQAPVLAEVKPHWIPKSVIETREELELFSRSIQLKGEKIRRMGIPVNVTVSDEWLARYS
jgi:hypothetical protein